MTRDPARLTTRGFDLLVIGGGIHGLFAAWDAATRGLAVALVERDDFGAGLSFNHQRTIHGGLRALESGNLLKVRAQIAERRRWAAMAPGLIRPIAFLVPIRKRERPSRLIMSAGLRVYDALGHARNDGLPPHLHLPPSRVVSTDEALSACPDLTRESLTGGALWFDYQTVYPDRLNWLVAAAADRAGAVLVNHVEADAALRERGRVAGARVTDRLTGRPVDVRARATLLAAGAGLANLFTAFGLDDKPPPLVAAANILVDRPAASHAVAARGPSGRRLTSVPWAGLTLIGTFQGDGVSRSTDPFPIDLETMLVEANAAFPWIGLTPRDVRLVHRGLVPATVGAGVELQPDSSLIRHSIRGVPGVVSVVGVKFTTARLAARAAVDAVLDELGADRSVSGSAAALPHSAPATSARAPASRARALGLDDEVLSHLDAWYGDEAVAVVEYAERRGLLARLGTSPVLEAEIAYAVEQAGACRLGDAVLRRTSLGATGEPEPDALARAASVMGQALGWSADARAREIASVGERFATGLAALPRR